MDVCICCSWIKNMFLWDWFTNILNFLGKYMYVAALPQISMSLFQCYLTLFN